MLGRLFSGIGNRCDMQVNNSVDAFLSSLPWMQTETALIYDAVHLFAQALHDLDHSQNIDTRPLSCDGSETWQHGNSLVNYMKLVREKKRITAHRGVFAKNT